MASRTFLLYLLVSLLTVSYIECRGGFRGGGRGHSRGHSSSHSRGSWGSRSHSWSHSGSSSSHSYPSSSSGLSGSSGSSGSHSYPASSSGLSGSGSSWSSGSSSSGSRSHSYPTGTGLSGSHSNGNHNQYNRPTHTYNTHSGHYTPNVHYGVPSYYTAPQYVYIHDYRNSNSRYGDLLTGLTLYNYGRSQSYYHNHYYHDDYYRRRYDNSGSTSYNQGNKPQDSANCVLKVKENGREEVLKIPCEIVSTFTVGSKKVAPSQQTQVNKTVCTSTITRVNNTVSSVPEAAVTPGLALLPDISLNSSVINSTNTSSVNKTKSVTGYDLNALLSVANNQDSSSLRDIYKILESINNVNGASVTGSNSEVPNNNSTDKSLNTLAANSSMNSTVLNTTTTLPVNGSSGSVTTTVTTVNATTVNVTVCTTNSTSVDPMTVQGPPVNPKNMQCVVEIQTKEALFSNVIDCNALVAYAKLPEPKKNTGILPERQKLKSWLEKPPWWMSLFIAV